MSSFKRASLAGSEELFRPTRPTVVDDDVITEVVDRAPPVQDHRLVGLTQTEIELLLESIQAAKYPEQRRGKPALEKFERLDDLKARLQEVYGGA